MLTYEDVKNNSAVRTYIQRADESLTALGYTEHSFAHVTAVAENAAYILSTLGYPERTVELAKIAGFLHDIGNLVNRVDHSQSGAVMAFRILDNMDCPPEEIATIVTAIGNHDEGTGMPVNAVAADGHAVHHEAGGQDHAHQAGEDGDEGAQQARIHKTHEAVRQVQHQHQGQVQAGHPAGADLGGAQQLLHLLLQLLSVDQLCHHNMSWPPDNLKMGRPEPDPYHQAYHVSSEITRDGVKMGGNDRTG